MILCENMADSLSKNIPYLSVSQQNRQVFFDGLSFPLQEQSKII